VGVGGVSALKRSTVAHLRICDVITIIYCYILRQQHSHGHTWHTASVQVPRRSTPSHNQSIKGPHKATHGQIICKYKEKPHSASTTHHRRGQQTLHHEVTQAWGAVNTIHDSTSSLGEIRLFRTPFSSSVACSTTGTTPPPSPAVPDRERKKAALQAHRRLLLNQSVKTPHNKKATHAGDGDGE